MNASLATLVYALGIVGLFYLNRDKSVHTSRALWIPVIWFWILGSRAVSLWLAGGDPQLCLTADALMDGSPIDAVVFQLLLVSGLAVLARRGNRCLSLLAANWPIVWYFAYCLLSVVVVRFSGRLDQAVDQSYGRCRHGFNCAHGCPTNGRTAEALFAPRFCPLTGVRTPDQVLSVFGPLL